MMEFVLDIKTVNVTC